MNAMPDRLQQEMVCEGLLECVHGLKPLDRTSYGVLVESDDPLTIDEVAERIDRDRSTAYRSIQRLFENGVVRKEQVTYDQGGYHHVYEPADPSRVARDMRRTLNDWYAKMSRLVEEFEETYDDAIDGGTAAEAIDTGPAGDE